MLIDGGNATAGAASDNAGRTWKSGPVPAATACLEGPSERQFTVNPRVSLGSDGTAWHGASWAGNGGGFFSFGMEANSSPDGGESWLRGPTPAGSGQDIAILPARSAPGLAHAVWLRHDQVPNPATYLPAGMDMRSATVTAGQTGAFDGLVAYEPGPGQLLDDPKLQRASDRSLLVLVSEAPLSALVGAVNPLTAADPIRFRGLALRSADGETWTGPVEAGSPVFFTHTHAETGTELAFGLSDATTGRAGRAAIGWAEPATESRSGRLVVAESSDAGSTWSEPMDLIAPAPLLFAPAITYGRSGRLAAFWYDNRNDRPGDERLDVDAWAAIVRPGKPVRAVHLAGSFDLLPLLDPPGYEVDTNALGVVQDVVPMARGKFGYAFTVPAADDGVTDVRFSVVGPRRGGRGR